MIRLIGLFVNYILFKIKYLGKVKFVGFTVIHNFKNSKINFGKNVTIKSSFLSNLVGLYQRTIIVAREGGEIIIGDNVGISGSTIYSLKSITIGNNTLIGANCKIIDNDFHPLDFEARRKDDRDEIKKREIKIGDDCFIGMNSIILKGAEIGNNCIVGAGSVISGKFPDNVIIAGNPGKIIKKIDISEEN